MKESDVRNKEEIKDDYRPNTDDLQKACDRVSKKAGNHSTSYSQNVHNTKGQCQVKGPDGKTKARIELKEGSQEINIQSYRKGTKPVETRYKFGGDRGAKITGMPLDGGLIKIERKDLDSNLSGEWGETIVG
jgi:hypothetical protein